MTRVFVLVVVTAALLYAGLCLALYLFQRSLIYFPQPRSLGPGASATTLSVPGANLVVTTRPLQSEKAVVYFGGNAEDVSASLPELEAAFPDHALYLLHYRGYGGSSGSASEAALHADALALHDQARSEHPHITVVGRSLGTGVAIRLATERPVSRLVLVTPYDSLEELAVQQFPLFPVRWLLRDRFESSRHAARVSAPTTLIIAEHDEVIPAESAKRLHARFPQGVARHVLIPGVGHNTVSGHPAYLPALRGVP